ncbi:MAG: YihY/virulence factor BrkB family protein [Acidobacteria bacterium]|nr:YihY/virulence factor BrkB family protein [Acidobacteriota bacterium]
MFTYFRLPVGPFRLAKSTARGIMEDDCDVLAAALAFYFFLSLFPALIFGVALLGFLPIQGSIQPMLDRLSQVAPKEVVTIIEGQLRQVMQGGGSRGLLTFGMIATIWSSSSALVAIIDTLNKVYGIEESRPWWKVRGLAILLTIGITLFTLLALTLVLVGPVVANWLDTALEAGSTFIIAWQVFRWAAAFLLASIGIGIVYNFGPDAETKWVWLTPGSLLATTLWILGSLGFSIYVAYFGNYNATYGTIGGIIVLLLWFYISGFSILAGAELDSKIDEAVIEKKQLPRGTMRRRIGAALEHS